MPETIKIDSDAFENGGMIPNEYGRGGQNLSPQLSWDSVEGVRSWALIVDDPDAPSGTFVHWVLFNLPGDKTSLPPGASRTKDQLEGAIEGVNDSGETGYTGPYPPSGTHRYFFKIYGLDSMLDLRADTTKAQLLAEIAKHNKIAEGELMGRYSSDAKSKTADRSV